MKKNRKVFHIRRQTASAMVLAVLSPGMFPAGLAMAESAGTLAPVMRNGYARATESDAEGDLQDFDEENLDEVELEADLITDFDKNIPDFREADASYM
jgi:hypothetical protein